VNPYITASIIMQILYPAVPKWKQDMQERRRVMRASAEQENAILDDLACVHPGWGLLQLMGNGVPAIAALSFGLKVVTLLFWTAGAMFMLWLGGDLGNGIETVFRLMIFRRHHLSLPNQAESMWTDVKGSRSRRSGAP